MSRAVYIATGGWRLGYDIPRDWPEVCRGRLEPKGITVDRSDCANIGNAEKIKQADVFLTVCHRLTYRLMAGLEFAYMEGKTVVVVAESRGGMPGDVVVVPALEDAIGVVEEVLK